MNMNYYRVICRVTEILVNIIGLKLFALSPVRSPFESDAETAAPCAHNPPSIRDELTIVHRVCNVYNPFTSRLLNF